MTCQRMFAAKQHRQKKESPQLIAKNSYQFFYYYFCARVACWRHKYTSMRVNKHIKLHWSDFLFFVHTKSFSLFSILRWHWRWKRHERIEYENCFSLSLESFHKISLIVISGQFESKSCLSLSLASFIVELKFH